MEHKKKILVVEDDAGSRKLILLVLGRAYDLIEAANGAEAIDLAHASEPPDLIITDLELPDVTGDKLILQLKDDPSTTRIPVLVTTASDRGSLLVQQAIDAGAAAILYKPTPMNVLMAEVDRYLSQ
jgi:CheY-like chemotaxis protein